MDIWLKIKNRRNELGLTLKEVAKALGVSESTVQRYETSEIKNMGIDKVEALANILKVTPEYLMGWADEKGDYSSYGALPVTKRKIPVLGNVHCGDPVYAEEDFLDVVDSDIEADFALRAVGDSMTGVGIEENDLVFVKKQPSVKNGELAVILLNDEEAAIKRVYKYDSYISLNAENPAYQPLIFHDGDSGKVEILGRVVAHLHYYKERK